MFVSGADVKISSIQYNLQKRKLEEEMTKFLVLGISADVITGAVIIGALVIIGEK